MAYGIDRSKRTSRVFFGKETVNRVKRGRGSAGGRKNGKKRGELFVCLALETREPVPFVNLSNCRLYCFFLAVRLVAS